MEGSVLEVGAGMGPISRVLGEAGLDVVALEGSPRRARIAAVRCADLPNVNVVAASLQELPDTARFDTIVVVGVLEYARVYYETSEDGDPVDLMLNDLRRRLNPNGALYLAIENQLGLKYFAGYPEDHLGVRMASIEDQYRQDTVVTFGRKELGDRLAVAGLPHHEWWFPFPDYKVPTTVISERGITSQLDVGSLTASSANADPQRPLDTTFALGAAWRVVARNGLAGELANSFMVRASLARAETPHDLAWHFGTDRHAEFAKVVRFSEEEGQIRVTRTALSPATHQSEYRMTVTEEEFRPGSPWLYELAPRLGVPGWRAADIAGWAERWWEALLAAANSPEVTAKAIIPGKFMDAVPRNLLVSGGESQFIDLEWESKSALELGRVMFRGLHDSLASLDAAAEPNGSTDTAIEALILEVSAELGLPLDSEEIRAYWRQEAIFQETVSGFVGGSDAQEALRRSIPVRRKLEQVFADSEVGSEVPSLKAELMELRTENQRRGERADELVRAVETLVAERAQLAKNWAELSKRGSENHRQEQARLAEELQRSSKEGEALAQELESMRQTVSWRATLPLRRLRKTGAGGAVRGMLRMLYSGARRVVKPSSISVAEEVPGGSADTKTLNATYYRARYNDLSMLNDAELELHFRNSGKNEGRRHAPLADQLRFDARLDESKETVVVVSHDASRTGAPILAWNVTEQLRARYNVVVVLRRSGSLIWAFQGSADVLLAPPVDNHFDDIEAGFLVDRIVEEFSPIYAVVNTTESRDFIEPLEARDVPCILLIHEFAESMSPRGALAPSIFQASEIVFPADVVAQSANREYTFLKARAVRVVAQGLVRVPSRHDAELEAADPPLFADDGDFLVVGAGSITWRKGLEFFLQAAAACASLSPGRKIKFVWVGAKVPEHAHYLELLNDQIRTSEIGGVFKWVDELENLAPVYERADAFFLSSRLDPLPNVAVEAAIRGIPIVTFDRASGLAELLKGDARLSSLVVPYLDSWAAAIAIVALAVDEAAYAVQAEAIREMAARAFDMEGYIAELDGLGRLAHRRIQQSLLDLSALSEPEAFDSDFFWGSRPDRPSEKELHKQFLRMSRLALPLSRARSGLIARKGLPGFNPLVYAESHPNRANVEPNPLIDWQTNGRPDGPWSNEVLTCRPRPSSFTPKDETFKVLVHAHFYYSELIVDFLERLNQCAFSHDLILTTDSEEKARVLHDVAQRLKVAHEVIVMPNSGRDIGPLLTGLGRARLSQYGLLLHVHGKKSTHVSEVMGDGWREFLWGSLVGSAHDDKGHTIADSVVAAFAVQPDLGLVFPDDPHLNDWDENRHIAEDLAAKMGLDAALPNHFTFPMGTMFWARPSALGPLFDLGLGWADYPPEPVEIDGTLLHALERLIPFSVQHQGYKFSTTHVPGIYR
jgi:glycosyltransferase involved in cell wall biosynthesis